MSQTNTIRRPYPKCCINLFCNDISWWIVYFSLYLLHYVPIGLTYNSFHRHIVEVHSVELCDQRGRWKLSRISRTCHFLRIHRYITDACGNISVIPSSNMADTLDKRPVSVLGEIDRHIKRNVWSPLWFPSIRWRMTPRPACCLDPWRADSASLRHADAVAQGH